MSKALKTAAMTALLGFGALAYTAGSASAYVACNDGGDCWHTDRHEHYNGVNVQWHPDNWYWHHDWDNEKSLHWHHYHEGRGYWRAGVWVPL
jgi:hypothetical protein